MATVSMDVAGLLALAGRLDRRAVTVHAAAVAIVAAGAQEVVQVARQNLANNRQTGETAGSLGYDLEDGGLTARIGPTNADAWEMEYGTSRQAPEPYLRPAADVVRPKVVAQLAALMARPL